MPFCTETTLLSEIDLIPRPPPERHAAENECGRLFTLSLDPMCIGSAAGYFQRVNPAWEKTFGFTEAEMQKMNFLDAVHPEDRSATLAEMNTITAGHPTYEFECRNVCKDRTYKWILWSGTVGERDGSVYAVGKDITLRRQVESALKAAKDAAEAANQAKSDFLDNMSHEIRMPMNAIMGFTDITLDTILTSEQRGYLERVKSAADSLLGILNAIMDFSELAARKVNLQLIEFDLRKSIEVSANELEVRADLKGLDSSFSIEPDVPSIVVGDPGRLRQILDNLIGNAIKFTETGEVAVKVERLSESRGEVELLFGVTDTGRGIQIDRREAVFESFVQADGSSTRKFGGTGLGLAIASQLVKKMGGRIWLNSIEGQGSVFHFTVRLGIRNLRIERHSSIEVTDPRSA
jgi:two-component system sensor histidine kinase/response regulator